LVGYAPLPHGYIKEELGVEDGHDEFSFGEQVTSKAFKKSLVDTV